VHPFDESASPIWVANFVLMEYGGAIFGCPAHDQRDLELLKIPAPVIPVVLPRRGPGNFRDRRRPLSRRRHGVQLRFLDGLLVAEAKRAAAAA